MSGEVYQHPEKYVFIANEGEFLEMVKRIFSQRPLIELFVFPPSFFGQTEFLKNRFWQQEIKKIVWLQEEKQSDEQMEQILQFVLKKQEQLVVVQNYYSPPPLEQDQGFFNHRGLKKWQENSQRLEKWRLRFLLNLPRATVIVGQDVLWSLEETQKLSWGQQTRDWLIAGRWPKTKNEDQSSYYWQTAADFQLALAEKIFTPLVGMKFWLKGKKTSAGQWREKLALFYEDSKKLELKIEEVGLGQEVLQKKDVKAFGREIEVGTSKDAQLKMWDWWYQLVESIDFNEQIKKVPKEVERVNFDVFSPIAVNNLFAKKTDEIVPIKSNLTGDNHVSSRKKPENVTLPATRIRPLSKNISGGSRKTNQQQVVILDNFTTGRKVQEILQEEKKRKQSSQLTEKKAEYIKTIHDLKQNDQEKVVSPLPEKVKKQQQKTRRGVMVICFMSAVVIFAVMMAWVIWEQTQRGYQNKVWQVTQTCVNGCDWIEERKGLNKEQDKINQRKGLYLAWLDYEQQAQLQQWQDLQSWLVKWQENRQELELLNQRNQLAIMGRIAEKPDLEKYRASILQGQEIIKQLQVQVAMVGEDEKFREESQELIAALELTSQELRSMELQRQWTQLFWLGKSTANQTFGQERNLAIILLEESDLRPGGGVSDEAWLVKMAQGKIVELLPYSAQEIDRQLEVSTSSAKVRSASSNDWREIAQDGEFELVGIKAAWQLEQAFQLKIDGVMAVYVSDLNFNSQTGGKSSRAEVEKTISQLLETDNLFTLAEMGQVRMWLAEAGAQAEVTENGWAGSLTRKSCEQVLKSSNCETDQLVLLGTQLEGDGQLKLKVEEKVELKSDQVMHEVRLNFNQVRAGESIYRWQLIWPRAAQEVGVKINGQNIELNNQTLEMGFSDTSQQQLVLSYTLPHRLGSEDNYYFYTNWLNIPRGVRVAGVQTELVNRLGGKYRLIAPTAVKNGDDLLMVQDVSNEKTRNFLTTLQLEF